MSLTDEKRLFLNILIPAMNDLLVSSRNLRRIVNDPMCEVEVFIRDQILINKTTFSISKFKFSIEKLHPRAINRLLIHFDEINLPLYRIYKKAQLNPLTLNEFELELHKLILDGDINTFYDFLLY